jgi:hypothetical protein
MYYSILRFNSLYVIASLAEHKYISTEYTHFFY